MHPKRLLTPFLQKGDQNEKAAICLSHFNAVNVGFVLGKEWYLYFHLNRSLNNFQLMLW